MKFVADIDIPFLKGVLEPYGEVVYKKGLDICRDDIIDSDALLIRTRTRCDEELLEGTKVSIITTATINKIIKSTIILSLLELYKITL